MAASQLQGPWDGPEIGLLSVLRILLASMWVSSGFLPLSKNTDANKCVNMCVFITLWGPDALTKGLSP